MSELKIFSYDKHSNTWRPCGSTIFTLSCTANDRHSGELEIEPVVRTTIEKAREKLNEVAIQYLADHDAINPKTGEIDYDCSVEAIDDEQEYKHVKDLSEYITSKADSLEIRIDGEGTHAKWSITEHDLNDPQ
jgi:hypothetical protein